MVKRIKIGLIYTYNEQWIAGSYYILNLIHALNTLNDEHKPQLTILSYKEDEFETVKSTAYPYLTFKQLKKEDFQVSYSLTERIINKGARIVLNKNLIHKRHTQKRLTGDLDLLFPAGPNAFFNSVKCKLFWIPDFQELFLPQFFSPQEIQERKEYKSSLAKGKSPIVFSSYNAQQHFKQNYPHHPCKTFVLQFAVTHPPFKHIDQKSLKLKYMINSAYFFCPNQFWAHKNHLVVLEAISILKKQNKDILIVFSGKEHDYRNPDYFLELKKFISEKQIEEQVRFLGFIDRAEQLQLINHSIAVIQPSFFEGWSTVVEDAKSIGTPVILSNLEVHKEQLKQNVLFFDPYNANELASAITIAENKGTEISNEYSESVKGFGKQFMSIANQCLG